jgi:divinyl chlorophyllide a 8-vinyl-reductase
MSKLILLIILSILSISCYSLSLRMSTTDKRVVVVGSTGYIGKYVVKESVRRGYETIAVVRPGSQPKESYFDGARVVYADVTDVSSIQSVLGDDKKKLDVMISCLASRSGTEKDSYLIDYQATSNSLKAARSKKFDQFILLSAICVRKPLLHFQNAKLKFESELTSAGDIKYSIVRPTAFFKSVSGQVELLQQGWPFVMFGDGEICKCNPIAETDLAAFMLNCVDDETKWNKIMDLGGPDEGMTMKQQGEMIFDILGKKPSFITAPIGIFDAVIGAFEWFGQWFDGMKDAAELGRIGKYYAVEDMLTTDSKEKFGTVTLRQHYERIAVEGQEYDPYTTVFAKKKE